MKKVVLMFFSALLASSAMADSIDFTTKSHSYRRYPDQMRSIVATHEDMLNEYLGKKLECRSVKLDFNNMKTPGLFEKGRYRLNLTAECNLRFSDFDMEVTYDEDLGEPYKLLVSYVNSKGRLVQATLEVKNYND